MTLCWWCSHDIGNSTVKAPTNFVRARRENVKDTLPPFMNPSVNHTPIVQYDVEGFFCSFECARSHILSEKRHNYESAIQTLCHMRRVTMKEQGIETRCAALKSAPTWKTLKQFGGTLTIEEFRDSDKEWVINPHNYISNPINVIQSNRKITEPKQTWDQNKKIIKETQSTTNQLKIKRSKPKTNVPGFSDIGSTLGIKVVVKD